MRDGGRQGRATCLSLVSRSRNSLNLRDTFHVLPFAQI